MMIIQKSTLIVALVWMASNVSAGDEISLQNLRFFFTPEQRSPKPVIPVRVVKPLPVANRRPIKNVHSPSIYYVGEIRSSAKRRLFWKKRGSKYFSIVPQKRK